LMSDEFDKVIARVYLKDHSCNLHAPLFDRSYRKHFQTIRASSMSISRVIDMGVNSNRQTPGKDCFIEFSFFFFPHVLLYNQQEG